MTTREQGPNVRRLGWDACRNVRDLGGLPTADGGVVAAAALVRADNLCRLTPAGRAALREHGIRTIVDVRFPEEVAAERHPFQDSPPSAEAVTYLNIPVSSGRDPSDDVSAAFAATRTREEANKLELDVNPIGFARIVSAFARAPAGGVVIHCQSGKDRTGIAVALLLSLVGVPDQDIAADYALSLESMQARPDPSAQTPRPGGSPWWSQPHHYRDCDPEAMLATLAHLRAQHGGAESYLLGGGASESDLAAVRQRLRG